MVVEVVVECREVGGQKAEFVFSCLDEGREGGLRLTSSASTSREIGSADVARERRLSGCSTKAEIVVAMTRPTSKSEIGGGAKSLLSARRSLRGDVFRTRTIPLFGVLTSSLKS